MQNFTLPLLLAFLFTFSAHADDTKKSDLKDLKKDYEIICELSKMEQHLEKSTAFKEETGDFAEKADLVARIGKMLNAAVTTPEVKASFEAMAGADAKSKERMWNDSAKQLGVKRWSCPGIGEHL